MNNLIMEHKYYIEIEYLNKNEVYVRFPKIVIDTNLSEKIVKFKIKTNPIKIVKITMDGKELVFPITDEDTVEIAIDEVIQHCIDDYGLTKDLVLIKEDDKLTKFYEKNTFGI